jgi:uncharacterized membrane protein YeaQ/YmgE (transglycosylase-associated protein family)
MEILWTIIIGFFVGLIARFLMPGRDNMGFIFTTLLGIVGAVVAHFLGQALGLYRPEEPAGFIAAVLGAMILLFVARMFRKRAY